MSELIPEKSEASIKNGTWFIFEDGENIIQIWCSHLSGKEKIFLNGELVSEKRNLAQQSHHSFASMNAHQYDVSFKTTDIMSGRTECRLSKNDEPIKTFTVVYQRGKNFTITRFAILIAASATYGLIAKHYNLPDVGTILFIVTILIIHFITRNPGKIFIEE